MKPNWKIMEEMKEALKCCHNCGGELKQISDWRLQCLNCGHRYSVGTLRERWAGIAAALFILGIAAGIFLTYIVSLI